MTKSERDFWRTVWALLSNGDVRNGVVIVSRELWDEFEQAAILQYDSK